MITKFALFSNALAYVALAASSSQPEALLARQPPPIQRAEWPGPPSNPILFTKNRAGAVLNETSSFKFTEITGTFTVPNLTNDGSGSGWVGLGNENFCNSKYVVQAGVEFKRSKLKNVTDCRAWWNVRAYGDRYNFQYNLAISPGDDIGISIVLLGPDLDNHIIPSQIVIGNKNTGQFTRQQYNFTTANDICNNIATWISERGIDQDGSPFPFAYLTDMIFTGANATSSNGTIYTPSDGDIVDIVNSTELDTFVQLGRGSVAITILEQPK